MIIYECDGYGCGQVIQKGKRKKKELGWHIGKEAQYCPACLKKISAPQNSKS